MKRFFKYLFLVILALLIVLVAGLLIYYQSLYEETPVPDPITIAPVGEVSARPDKPVLLPVPKNVVWKPGTFTMSANMGMTAPREDAGVIKKVCANRLPDVQIVMSSNGPLRFVKSTSMEPQAYRLTIDTRTITIVYSDMAGLYYAMTTLRHIANQSGSKLPCVEIVDSPDLKTRGAMLDISRGKVPKLETLYTVVDYLADLKYNQLQLYIEGFSFGYPSFTKYWEQDHTPLLPEEIRALDAYCSERFIELVPNHNTLGHMQDWLKLDDFKDLAECPEGFKFLGLIDMKTTLNPTDHRSLELVKNMSEDLLPNFTSKQFNVNLDEPFELGKCDGRKIDDPKEVAVLYLDYAKKLNEYVKSKDKNMLMWGDVISNSPGIIGEIPKDITLLEWRYEAIQSYDKVTEEYQRAGLRYLVCPGTSSWSSYTGRTDNMLRNVENAVTQGVAHGAAGMLITDWGDTPHQQYLTVSYPGWAYGAALSWNEASRDAIPLASYLAFVMFKDSSGIMGNLVMDMGRYNQFEEYPMVSMTTTNLAMRFGLINKVMSAAIRKRLQRGLTEMSGMDTTMRKQISEMFQHPKVYNSATILSYLDSLNTRLSQVKLSGPDAPTIVDEYRNSLRMARAATLMKHYINYNQQQSDEENKVILEEIRDLCAKIVSEHEQLWMQRNKLSGYDGSIENFRKLETDAIAQLELLEAGAIRKGFRRSLEKVVTAGVAAWF